VIGPLLERTGFLEDASAGYRCALEALRAAGDQTGTAVVERQLAGILGTTGRCPEALDLLDEALATHRAGGDRLEQVRTLMAIGRTRSLLGAADDALRSYRDAEALLGEAGPAGGGEHAGVLGGVGNALADLGRPAEALNHHRRALAIGRGLGNPYAEAAAELDISRTYTLLGDLGPARGHCDRSLAVSRRAGGRETEARALHGLAEILLRQGRFVEALAAARESLVLARELGGPGLEVAVLDAVGRIHLGLGDPDEARACRARAATVAGEAGLPLPRGDASGHLAALGSR
jgi:tetratricopeptide (TPR) repeat protein